MRLGTVAALWRYPVKSMGGERLESATFTWRGIPGDRGWAIYDETRKGISGGKRLPRLRGCHARYLEAPVAGAASPAVEITLPDGSRFLSDDAESAQRLTAHVGKPVSLRALGPAGTETDPRITMQDEDEETVRQLNGLWPGEPMPDYSAFPPDKLRLLRQGNFFDALPVHLLTHTTLRTLENIAPDSQWEPRRFRMNLLVDADASDGYPELGWLGRRLRVGGAVLEMVAGCPRCVMVTQPFDEVPEDHRIMRTLVRETHHTAGVYARVAQEGPVKTGDPIEIVE